jgi:hypothetical protein
MFENTAHETKYVFTDTDETGKTLDGRSSYTISFPPGQLPPVSGFRSLTLYNEHHFYNVNRLSRYSLGTKSPNLQMNPDGSLTLYPGGTSPGDQERNWLPAPEGSFSLYIRGYWPKPQMLDRTWTPPTVAAVNA